jgi:hypothetical protein
MARSALFAVIATLSWQASAVGLGNPRGTVVMGQPLDIVIPVAGSEAAGLRAACVRLLPNSGAEDDHLPRVDVSIAQQGAATVIRLKGQRDINSPILDFRIRLECGLAFEKEYTLLPDARIAPIVEPGPIILPAAPTAPSETPPSAPAPNSEAPRPQAVAVPAADLLTIPGDTTLRQLARERYPNSARRRVAFIRRMVAANPERFPDPAAAADAELRAGEQLKRPVPPPKPARTTTPPAPAPAKAESSPIPRPAPAPAPAPKPAAEEKPAATPPAPKPAAEKPAAEPAAAAPAKPAPKPTPTASADRLSIGSGGSAQKMSIGEATQAMDRMNELMNQQIQMQMEMTKQIGELHGQIEQLRNTLNAVQVEKQQVERKLEEERSSPKQYLMLLFAIVAGGLGGAGVLAWLAARRRQEDEA